MRTTMMTTMQDLQHNRLLLPSPRQAMHLQWPSLVCRLWQVHLGCILEVIKARIIMINRP